MTVCQAQHFNRTAENFRISREEFKYHLDMYPSDTLRRLRSGKKCYLKAIDTHPFARRRGITLPHTKKPLRSERLSLSIWLYFSFFQMTGAPQAAAFQTGDDERSHLRAQPTALLSLFKQTYCSFFQTTGVPFSS